MWAQKALETAKLKFEESKPLKRANQDEIQNWIQAHWTDIGELATKIATAQRSLPTFKESSAEGKESDPIEINGCLKSCDHFMSLQIYLSPNLRFSFRLTIVQNTTRIWEWRNCGEDRTSTSGRKSSVLSTSRCTVPEIEDRIGWSY
jgi:hypothetical protein